MVGWVDDPVVGWGVDPWWGGRLTRGGVGG